MLFGVTTILGLKTVSLQNPKNNHLQEKQELLSRYEDHQAESAQRQEESAATAESLRGDLAALKAELASSTRAAKEAESTLNKGLEDHRLKAEKLETKVDNQRQVCCSKHTAACCSDSLTYASTALRRTQCTAQASISVMPTTWHCLCLLQGRTMHGSI